VILPGATGIQKEKEEVGYCKRQFSYEKERKEKISEGRGGSARGRRQRGKWETRCERKTPSPEKKPLLEGSEAEKNKARVPFKGNADSRAK